MKIENIILSSKQIQILQFVKNHGAVMLKNVYENLGMNKKTASYHLRKLEDLGYLKEVQSIDHRSKPRVLSPIGEKILKNNKIIPNYNENQIELGIEELDSLFSKRVPWHGTICGMRGVKNALVIIPSNNTRFRISIINATELLEKNIVDGKIHGFQNYVGKMIFILKANNLRKRRRKYGRKQSRI